MNQHLCKYAVVRFLPYRETEEFVNVGVVIMCEKTGLLGYALERRHVTRVSALFKELDMAVYRHGVKELQKEMQRLGFKAKDQGLDRAVHLEDVPDIAPAFEFLVRPRKTIFCFSSVRVLLCPDPVEKLDQLFAHYVRRQFAQRKEYQEKLMRKSIQENLEQWNLSSLYHERKLGIPTYLMSFPFVHEDLSGEKRAISALNLNYDSTTEILQKGDQIVGGLQRLRDAGALPEACLFVVKGPEARGLPSEIAAEVCEDVRELAIETTSDSDIQGLHAFASRALAEESLMQQDENVALTVSWD